MTPEQHKQFSEACTAFGEALERIFSTTKNKEEERQKAKEIIDKYKREGILKDKPKAPTMERQEPARDWEILEFGNESRLFKSKGGGWYCVGGEYYQENQITLLGKEPIHSVRRLSDNTVWTVGDNTSRGIIKKFTVNDGTLFVYGDDWNTLIRTLMKAVPLFTTADGVEVYDKAQTVYALFWPSGTISEIGARFVLAEWMIYSTREAAELAHYNWLSEQPVLTLKDLEFRGLTGKHRDELKQIVKDKIAKR